MSAMRENWVDSAKGLAILLVVLGHGFMGLLFARLLPFHAQWWGCKGAIYCFHIQLFFLCSGYLWQRFGRSSGWRGHVRAMSGKAWCLGVPYVAFTSITWGLKTLCGHAVNQSAGSLWKDLFVEPVAPYWFLPALFLLFALFPRIQGKAGWAAGFVAAAAAKAVTVAWNYTAWCFPARAVALHAFWFSAGMGLALCGTGIIRGNSGRWIGMACALLFLAGAVTASTTGMWWHQWWWCKAIQRALGLLACTAVLAWAVGRDACQTVSGTWAWLGRNSLPIFLMHTVFAVAVRIGLVALGIRSLWFHIPAMLAASFAGPLAAMRVLEWVRLDSLVYPRRRLDEASDKARIELSNEQGPR